MKIAQTIVRILMGLMFLAASLVVLLNLVPPQPLEGNMKLFNEGVMASGYLMPLIKVVELVCSIAFLTGRFMRLAAIVILPITVNILFVHGFLAPEGLPVAIFLFLGNLFLIYRFRESYRPMLAVK